MLKIKICRISRQIRGSPPQQESASDSICGLTGLCVYLFYPNLFPSQIDFPQKNNRNAPLNVCNSFLLHLFKVKVKLEPHEEQIFVDDDDEVSVSYVFLQGRPCFILLKVYLFYPEKIQIQKCNFFSYDSFEWSHRPVADLGGGPEALPPSPLFLDPGSPLSKGLDDRPFPTPLISTSGSGTAG